MAVNKRPVNIENAFNTLLAVYSKAADANIHLWRSEAGRYYWVGHAGMGIAEARVVSPIIHDAANILEQNGHLVATGQTITVPVDIGEPLYQYQQLNGYELYENTDQKF